MAKKKLAAYSEAKDVVENLKRLANTNYSKDPFGDILQEDFITDSIFNTMDEVTRSGKISTLTENNRNMIDFKAKEAAEDVMRSIEINSIGAFENNIYKDAVRSYLTGKFRCMYAGGWRQKKDYVEKTIIVNH